MNDTRILHRLHCGLLEAVIGSVTLKCGDIRFGVIFQRRQTDGPHLHPQRGKEAGPVDAHFPPAMLFSYGDLLPLAKLARQSHDVIEALFQETMPHIGEDAPLEPSIAAIDAGEDGDHT